MKVLLINPPYAIEEYFSGLSKLSFTLPPFGLVCIAAYIRDRGIEVEIVDFQVFEGDFEKHFRDFDPDFVGITCQTALVYSTLELARRIKEIKNIPVAVGGVHPTFRPNDLIADENIDFVIKGEGEETFYELARALEKGAGCEDIKGLVYKKDKGIRENENRAFIRNLDELPFPAFDLLPLDKYRVSSDLYFGRRTAGIYTARGCPFKCTFCAIKVIFEHTIRYRSMASILEEIDYYVENYNIDSLFIVDDVFTLNRKRVREFCNHLIEKYGGKISWWAQTRADCIEPELLKLMKKAGCKILSFGVESGNDRLLKIINKGIELKNVARAVKMVKDSGISPRGSFILGLPTETVTESLRTIRLGLSLPFDRVKFGLATPYPGTELWELAIKEGKIKEEENWNRFTQMAGYTKHDAPYIPDNRGGKELKMLQVAGNLMFYMKPRIAFDIFRTYYRLGSLNKLFASARIFVVSNFGRKK